MPGTKKHEQKRTDKREHTPDCNEVPCVLDSPVRPRFFRGQLLTQEDLMAQQRWVQTKLRLDRLIFGWGVMCGLEVSVRATKASEASSEVVIRPGYAVNCAGEDIVVPKQRCYDVSQKCPAPLTRCKALPSTHAPEPGDTCLVQIWLHYAEREMAPQPVLGNGEQVPAQCEPSRILESYRLSMTVVHEEPKAWLQEGGCDVFVAEDNAVPLARVLLKVTDQLMYDIVEMRTDPPYRRQMWWAKTGEEAVSQHGHLQEQTSLQAPTPSAADPTTDSTDEEAETVETPADDLTKVSGIGKKSAAAFKAAGIHTFAALAELTLDYIEQILRAAGVPTMQINPTKTREDARRLAKEAT